RLPGAAIAPKDLKQRALMDQWISVENENFTPHAMKMIYQLVFGKWRGQQPDMKLVEEGRTALTRTVEVMERQLAKTPYIAGEAFTLADICYMPYIEYLFAGEAGDVIT